MSSAHRYSNRRQAEKKGLECGKPRQPSRYPKRNLRSASFWNDSDDENLNYSSGKKSWADLCEEHENNLESPMHTNDEKVRTPRKLYSSSLKSSPSQENGDVVNGSQLSNRKGRNLEDMFKLVEHSDSGSDCHRSVKSACDENTSASTSDNEFDDKIKKYETDQVVLSRRQKQIDYGKNTKAYKAYLKAVPKRDRVIGKHIFTPKKHIMYSRRSWDNQIKIWRKRLHEYEPASNDGDDDEEDNEVDLSGMIAMMSPK